MPARMRAKENFSGAGFEPL